VKVWRKERETDVQKGNLLVAETDKVFGGLGCKPLYFKTSQSDNQQDDAKQRRSARYLAVRWISYEPCRLSGHDLNTDTIWSGLWDDAKCHPCERTDENNILQIVQLTSCSVEQAQVLRE
jgi:hypothetical protein